MNAYTFIRRYAGVQFFAALTIMSLLLSALPVAFFVVDAVALDNVNVCIANQGIGSFAPGVKSVNANAVQVGLANSGINYDIVENGQNWDFVYPNGFTGQEIFGAECNAVISESISGTKYNDVDNDGSITGDDGIKDWEIRLYKVDGSWTLEDVVMTDDDGKYTFGKLPAGEYKVCEVLPENWTQTFVAQGTANISPNSSEEGPECRTVNVDKLKGSNTVNFGNYYEEPDAVVDFCDPSQKPGGKSIAEWHTDNQFNGSSCFNYEVTLQCGSLDVQFTENQTPYNYAFYYAIGNETPELANYEGDGQLPVHFSEDENGGLVDVTYYLVGAEKDYFIGSGVPNIWDGNGVTVTVDTDCQNEVPPVEIPEQCSVKVDEFRVPANSGAGSDTNVTLKNGREYFALVEGTYVFGTKQGQDRLADAEYSLDVGNVEWKKEFAAGRPDVLDLFIDGINPDFGSFRVDHTYGTLFTGTGAPSNFAIEDNPHSDNSGGLDVTIYECEPAEPPRCENLLVNGSFETPEVTNNSLWQKFTGAVTGWLTQKVSDDSETTLEIHRGWSGNDAAEGEQYAELDGDHSTKISQTIDTIPGAEYELKWAFAPRHNIAAVQNQLSVLINGVEEDTNGPATGSAGLETGDWTLSSYVFTADSDETTITFLDAGPSNSFGTFLDDAQLCLVREPEPEPEPKEPEVCSVAGEVVAMTETALKFNGLPVDADRRTIAGLQSVAPYSNFFGKEGNAWVVSDFLTLGVGGFVTYKFTDKVVVDQPGDDIAIWEITGGATTEQSNAKAIIAVSKDGITFVTVDTITGDGAIDISGTGLDYVQYVRVTDDSAAIGADDGGDGYDLDAITIIDGSCEEPDDSVVMPVTYTISGFKYELEGEELVPVPNWNIYAEDLSVPITLAAKTDEFGYYSFEVEAGDWEVTEEVLENWQQVRVEQDEIEVEKEGTNNAYCTFDSLDSVEGTYTCDFVNQFVGSGVVVPPVVITQATAAQNTSFTSGTKIKKPVPRVPSVLGAATTNVCPFLIDYMQMGMVNDEMEVMKLQLFLNIFKDMFGGSENLVTGEFDAATAANVKAFQEHFRGDVLDPWFERGIVPHNRPTGFVYKTTLWKINSIICPDYATTPDFAGEDLTQNVSLN